MDGIICIDKPAEHTSFDVVARVRGILKMRKIGHAGTLDPMTTGVLPIFLGRATKACDMLPVQDKRYTAKIRLGITTDTQDTTGTVLERHTVTASPEEFEAAIKSFVGEQMQLPPMYSAIRINGQRLYDIAREGREIERELRRVCFYEINILELGADFAVMDVLCSKGSYIRTLCHDIGQMLGCGAAMEELRRTMAAGFELSKCLTLEELEDTVKNGSTQQHICPMAQVFDALPKIVLTEKRTILYKNGVNLDYSKLNITPIQGDIAVFSADGDFLGISFHDCESDELHLRKLFSI